MKVSIHKQEDGRRTVIVQKTRRDENPMRFVTNVEKADLREVMRQAISEVAPTMTQEEMPILL